MKICGVVVLYNPTVDINSKIKSYLTEIDKLYIVDNSKNNNKNILIKSNKIKYIPNYDNLGIAYSLNLATKLAYNEKFDWILTMDQDSEFKGDNLNKLIQFIYKCDDKNVGIISPWHHTKEEKNKPKEKFKNVIEVMTSGNLVNINAWKKIGGWKDWFFIDNVDIEFCMNLNINGYKVIRLNTSELKHNLGDITKKKFLGKTFTCTNHNYLRQYYMIRNLYYLKDLYYKDFPINIKHMQRGAVGRLKNIIIWEKDKYRKIRNMFRGYKDYKKGIKGKYRYKN